MTGLELYGPWQDVARFVPGDSVQGRQGQEGKEHKERGNRWNTAGPRPGYRAAVQSQSYVRLSFFCTMTNSDGRDASQAASTHFDSATTSHPDLGLGY